MDAGQGGGWEGEPEGLSAQRGEESTRTGSESDAISLQGTAKVARDRCPERRRGVFPRPPRRLGEAERAKEDLACAGTGRGWGEGVKPELILPRPNPTGAVRLQVNLSPF